MTINRVKHNRCKLFLKFLMSEKNLPKCTILILNYYGEKIIQTTLDSVLSLDYPKEKLEIIIVDNNSQDKSREILKEYERIHSNLKTIFLGKNLGFSAGNNVGIKNASGDYIALLNNDCAVSKTWLKNLVETALSNSKIFAVASKILLYQKYLKFNITMDANLSFFYSFLSNSSLYKFTKKRIYFNFLSTEETLYTEIPYDPIQDKTIEVELVFNIKSSKSKITKNSVTFPAHAKVINFATGNDEARYKLSINTSKSKHVSKIQNAGIIPFQDGYARDIGAIVRDKTQYYEYDNGQYDKLSEVYAFCGAAVLLNKKILDKIGLLDETFFMYYEDVELSERARLKGFKIFYSPKAEVRHIHALSSKEGSKFFTYHVEKGRLLHIFLNFPFYVFRKQYLKVGMIVAYGVANILMSLRYYRAISKDKSSDKINFDRPRQLLIVLLYFIFNSPKLLFLKLSRKISSKSVNTNYEEILSGRWYFN